MEISSKSRYELERLMDVVNRKKDETTKELKTLISRLEPLVKQKQSLESALKSFEMARFDIEEALKDLDRRMSYFEKTIEEMLDSDLEYIPTDQLEQILVTRLNNAIDFPIGVGLFERRNYIINLIKDNSCHYCHSVCHAMHECPKLAKKCCNICNKTGHSTYKCRNR